MGPRSPLHVLFAHPSPGTAELLLDICAEIPGIVFAIASDGRIAFSGGKDIRNLPFDPRATVGLDHREVLAGHEKALEHIARALAGEEFEVKTEFMGRYFETRYAPVRSARSDGHVVGVIGIAHDVTMHRRMEQELQESQTLFRTVIETTDTGFVMLDQEGLVVDANDEYLRMTGFGSLAEIYGRRVTEWTAPHDLERNTEEVEKCLRYGMTRNLRIDYLDVRGHIVPIEINATYVYVDKQPRVLALCRDVSDRLKSEAELRKHERLSEAVLAAVPEAVVVLDPDGTIRAVNEGWREFVRQFSFGDDAVAGPGADYLEFFGRAAAEGVQVASTCAAGIRDVLARRKDRHEQEFTVARGKERRWYMKRATRLQQENDAVVVTHVELTARRAIQASLEEAERRYRALAEHATIGVLFADAQGRCVEANPAWRRTTGTTRESALGDGWASAVHAADRAEALDALRRAVEERRTAALELRLLPASAPTRCELAPIVDASGRVTGFVATFAPREPISR